MSVLKRYRSVSKAQFLTTLAKLLQEVEQWCKAQGQRNSVYVIDLFNDVKKAFKEADIANLHPLKAPDDAQFRKRHFKAAIHALHEFNADLTCTALTHDISNTKLKRWSGYSYEAINLMEALIQSDARRVG